MSSRQDTVSSEVDLRLVRDDGPDRAVHADLIYEADDPYAVCIAFHTDSEVVEWSFARSLLTDGITHPVGDGDVQVWPVCSTQRPVVCLALSSPFGRALFEAPLPPVVQFLTETHALVPAGCESDYLDVDAELAALLDRDLN